METDQDAQTTLRTAAADRAAAAGQPMSAVPVTAPAAAPGLVTSARPDREPLARGMAVRWTARVAGTVAVIVALAWLVRWAHEGTSEPDGPSASQSASPESARPGAAAMRGPEGGSGTASPPVGPPAGAQAVTPPAKGPASDPLVSAARPDGIPVSPSKRAPSDTGVAVDEEASAGRRSGDAARDAGRRPQAENFDPTPPSSGLTSSARRSVSDAPGGGTGALASDAPTAPPPAVIAAPSAAPLPPLRLNELPVSVQRAIPALRIDGVVKSPSPANRLLLVNGQPLREKETLVPGLRLETVGDDGAIFTWRGQRFQLPYPGHSPANPS